MVNKRPALDRLLNPSSIAVVGASEGSRHGGEVVRSLRASGYPGRIFPVNPRYERVYDLPCFPSLERIGEPIDCVVLAVARDQAPEQLRQAAAAGARGAVIVSGGFRETGDEGVRLERELIEVARRHDIRCLGPNTIGFVNVADKVGCYAASLPQGLVPGCIAATVQSGTVAGALGGAARGLRLSHLVSTGNESDVDTAELIDYFVDNASVRVIMTFVENIARPEAFLAAAARARAAGKPLILLKAGLSEAGSRMTATHTGALAGNARIHAAMCERYGIIAVDTMNEMIAVAELCAALIDRLPRSGGLAMMTHSGGEAAMFIDRCAASGLELPGLAPDTIAALRHALPAYAAPGNPLDVTGAGAVDGGIFRACLEAVVADPGVGLVAVMQDVRRGHWVLHQAAKISADVARSASKPIMMFSNTTRVFDDELDLALEAGPVPLIYGTEEAVRAARAVLRFAQDAPSKASPAPAAPREGALVALTQAGDEAGAKRFLALYGLPPVREQACGGIDGLGGAARTLGFPVALKILSPDITHKSEAGGVALGLADEAGLIAAGRAMLATVRERMPQARVTGFLVQEMIVDPVAEMIVGVQADPHAGPAVICGLGGIYAEIMDDVAVGLAPMDQAEAERLLKRLRGFPILAGARGRPKGDVRALARAVADLSQVAHELRGRLASIDINPLAVLREGKGVRMVDAVVMAGALT